MQFGFVDRRTGRKSLCSGCWPVKESHTSWPQLSCLESPEEFRHGVSGGRLQAPFLLGLTANIHVSLYIHEHREAQSCHTEESENPTKGSYLSAIRHQRACVLTVSSDAWTTGTTGTRLSRPALGSSSWTSLTLSRWLAEAPSPAPNNKVAPVRQKRFILPVSQCRGPMTYQLSHEICVANPSRLCLRLKALFYSKLYLEFAKSDKCRCVFIPFSHKRTYMS